MQPTYQLNSPAFISHTTQKDSFTTQCYKMLSFWKKNKTKQICFRYPAFEKNLPHSCIHGLLLDLDNLKVYISC